MHITEVNVHCLKQLSLAAIEKKLWFLAIHGNLTFFKQKIINKEIASLYYSETNLSDTGSITFNVQV